MTACTAPRRAGASLVESIVALALTGFIAAILTALVGRSTRTLSDETAQINQSSQVTFANASLRALLTDVSVADSDVLTASDTSIVYQMTVGGGVACDVVGSQLALVPDSLVSGARIATWSTSPQAGDSLAVLDDGPSLSELDDRWSKHAVTAVAHSRHRCGTSALVDSLRDRASVAYTFSVSPAVPPTAIGRPVRILRAARVALYSSAGEWMMGFAEYDGATSRWHTIQPVAGPLDAYRRGSTGLRFTFVDSAGMPAVPHNASAIQLALTATTPTRRTRGGGPIADTVRSILPLANRR